jgi:hypothetical protein
VGPASLDTRAAAIEDALLACPARKTPALGRWGVSFKMKWSSNTLS